MQDAQLQPGSALERFLAAPGFQRSVAFVLSVLGLLLTLGAYFVPLRGDIPPVGLPTGRLPSVAVSVAASMTVAMALVASGLGLLLALRGHRRTLTRLLGVSAASLGAGFGVFIFIDALVHRFMNLSDSMDYLYLLVAAFLAAIALLIVWMYSTAHFLVQFPKPVRLAGVDYAAGTWNRLAWKPAHGSWTWSSLASPQVMALVAGVGLILLTCTEDLLTSSRWYYVNQYFVCWIPFALISAKQSRLDEAGRKAIRWVLLGQMAWLGIFMLSMVGLIALREGGVVVPGGFTENNAFLNAFFRVFFAGFVIVLLLSLAFSIFYDGTLDPDLMIRKTWVFAVVGLGSGVVFVLLERMLAGLLAQWFGISAIDALTILAIVTGAVVYPFRKAAENAARRLFERWQFESAISEGARKEATIVFADLSGYTALTEKDERAALLQAAIFHRDAAEVARKGGGSVVKTIGDAVLMRFPESSSAYKATLDLRALFNGHVRAISLDPLPIHAGIHHGDVVEGPNGDIFGASVNLAARLLGAAGPDEIVASSAAMEAGTLHAKGESLGEKKFKNVAVPVACFRLAAA